MSSQGSAKGYTSPNTFGTVGTVETRGAKKVYVCVGERGETLVDNCRFPLNLEEDFIKTFVRGCRIQLKRLVTPVCEVSRQLARFLLGGGWVA